jgi:hypothetical protein
MKKLKSPCPMTHSKAIGIGSAVLFATLWAIPLERAISYFLWAQTYYAETASLDAADDVRFSSSLLASYFVSLLAALGLSWFAFRCSRLVFLLPFSLVAVAVITVIELHLEAPIVLFPTMHPWKPAYVTLASFVIGLLFHSRNQKQINHIRVAEDDSTPERQVVK